MFIDWMNFTAWLKSTQPASTLPSVMHGLLRPNARA